MPSGATRAAALQEDGQPSHSLLRKHSCHSIVNYFTSMFRIKTGWLICRVGSINHPRPDFPHLPCSFVQPR